MYLPTELTLSKISAKTVAHNMLGAGGGGLPPLGTEHTIHFLGGTENHTVHGCGGGEKGFHTTFSEHANQFGHADTLKFNWNGDHFHLGAVGTHAAPWNGPGINTFNFDANVCF